WIRRFPSICSFVDSSDVGSRAGRPTSSCASTCVRCYCLTTDGPSRPPCRGPRRGAPRCRTLVRAFGWMTFPMGVVHGLGQLVGVELPETPRLIRLHQAFMGKHYVNESDAGWGPTATRPTRRSATVWATGRVCTLYYIPPQL